MPRLIGNNRRWIAMTLAAFGLVCLGMAAPPGGNDDSPVQWTLEATPAKAHPGDEVVLTLRMKLVSPWFVHAESWNDGMAQPLKIETDPPEEIGARGDWSYPDGGSGSVMGHDAAKTYIGDAIFRQVLKVAKGRGEVAIRVMVTWSACNPQICAAPMNEELVARVVVEPQG